ncbi:MAG: DUF1080 domain-containing protein [Acidobacteria bacterium]|nr:DUF1080 domain-containing protein [Acidobacteriota bacterium]
MKPPRAWMVLGIAAVLIAPSPASSARPQAAGQPLVYNFDGDTPGKPPARFRLALTGQGSAGTWVVQHDPTAPSKPNVLAQTSTDTTDYRFPLAILEEGSFKDLDLSVKFKAVAGKVDQAAGLMFRVQDTHNYYVVRANALEDNYRLYHVVAGSRRQFGGVRLRVTPNQWHTLRVEVAGNRFKCYYDGELRFETTDNTFPHAGQVGLWTKADSVTSFDDLTVTPK